MVSNMSTITNEITSITEVNNEETGNFKPSLNKARKVPPSLGLKNVEKFSNIFQVTPEVLPIKILISATPKGIESKVALKIPIMTAPFTLKWARVVITIKPNKATIAEHARPPNFHSSGLLKSTSSTKVNLLLTIIPAFLKPIKAINSPIPTGIESRITIGIPSNIFSRNGTLSLQLEYMRKSKK